MRNEHVTIADAGASCTPPAPPKRWTFGYPVRTWPHILGREAREAWCAEWIEHLVALTGLSEEDTKCMAKTMPWLAPYEELAIQDRGCWDAAAQAAYDHGKKDALHEAKAVAVVRIGGRW